MKNSKKFETDLNDRTQSKTNRLSPSVELKVLNIFRCCFSESELNGKRKPRFRNRKLQAGADFKITLLGTHLSALLRDWLYFSHVCSEECWTRRWSDVSLFSHVNYSTYKIVSDCKVYCLNFFLYIQLSVSLAIHISEYPLKDLQDRWTMMLFFEP